MITPVCILVLTAPECTDRQVFQSNTILQQPQRHNIGAPRISLTPRSLHSTNEPNVPDGAYENIYSNPNAQLQLFNRASTLANLRTQPQSSKLSQTHGSPHDTATFNYSANRFSQLQPQRQQPTPPFNLGACMVPNITNL